MRERRYKLIHYIGFYNEPGDIDERKPLKSFASTEKMNYIASILSRKNKVRIISPGFSTFNSIFKEKRVKKRKFEVIYLSACGDGKDALTIKKIIWGAREIKNYITKFVEVDDKIIFYSTPAMWLFLRNTLMRYEWILELEEIYYYDKSKINPIRYAYKLLENDAIRNSKKIIYVSETLKKKVGKDGIVVYGPFESCEEDEKIVNHGRIDKSINVLYTGSIDKVRGAFTLAEAFAQISEKRSFQDKIKVCFVGYFHGKHAYDQRKEFTTILEFINRNGIEALFKENLSSEEIQEEIRSSDICVMPQKINCRFSEYSFPSKLPRYLSYGKLVVSSAIKPVMESPFKKFIIPYYSDELESLIDALVKSFESFSSEKFSVQNKELRDELKMIISNQEKVLLDFFEY